MSRTLLIKNRQRTIPLNLRHFRRLTRFVLQDLLWFEDYDLAVYIVRAPEMIRLNETYLQHKGSTDVITFNYASSSNAENAAFTPPQQSHPDPDRHRAGGQSLGIHGEIFVCIDEALAQARTFRTSWQSELARYVIHGILHLTGHDDLKPADRRRMKREEDRLLKLATESFPAARLSTKPAGHALRSP